MKIKIFMLTLFVSGSILAQNFSGRATYKTHRKSPSMELDSISMPGDAAMQEKLQAQLNANKVNLNLDAPLFKLRADHIETTLRVFRNDYKKMMSKELGDNLSKYKNYQKIYRRSIRKHEESMKEQKSLTEQLDNLHKGVIAGEITKEEFKVYYRTEKIDVEKQLQRSKEISKSLYEIEPEYTRLTTYFEPLLAELQP